MKCAMIFPGYGNQFIGMGKDLYDASRIIQERFEEAAHSLDINFVQICFASSEQELRRLEYAYPVLFLMAAACHALLEERSIIADVYTGCNVGGYTALHAGQALSFLDGLYIVYKLASFYNDCIAKTDFHAFRVSGLDEETVHNLCQASSTEHQWAMIGAYEDARTFVVIGHYYVAEALREHMNKIRNVKARRYPLACGAYAPICDAFMNQYKPYLEKIDYHDVTYPIIGHNGELCYSRDQVRSFLLNYLFQPAYHDRMMQHLVTYDAVIAPLAGKQLLTYLREHLSETSIYPVAQMSDIDTIEKDIIHRQEET